MEKMAKQVNGVFSHLAWRRYKDFSRKELESAMFLAEMDRKAAAIQIIKLVEKNAKLEMENIELHMELGFDGDEAHECES